VGFPGLSQRGDGRPRPALWAIILLFPACGYRTALLDASEPPDAIEPADTHDAVAETQHAAMAIAAGGCHTCALATDQRVLCWGCNSGGQVGQPKGQDRLSPVEVDWPDFRATYISAGYWSTCAIQASSSLLRCWGRFEAGWTSGGAEAWRKLDEPVQAVGNGNAMSCALTVSGRVLCWDILRGEPSSYGEAVVDGGPIQIAGLPADVAAISVGGYHVCALTAQGEVICWGSNESGQLGRDPPGAGGSELAPPVPLPPVISVATGWDHTCAVTVAGQVKCWGWNGFGQLGNNSVVDDTSTPVDVTGLDPDVVRVVGGPENHATCAVTAKGAVKCWGLIYPSLGSGWSPKDGPVSIPGLDMPIETLAIGSTHICALTRTNRILCGGQNDVGQLGTGSYANSGRPQFVAGF
jgi:alpha-tubulin suppressor-like RCC1 family protein